MALWIFKYITVTSSLFGLTFADIIWDAADLSIDHLLMQLFDVERLNSKGQSPCQHGKHAHTSATHTHTHTENVHTQKHHYLHKIPQKKNNDGTDMWPHETQ